MDDLSFDRGPGASGPPPRVVVISQVCFYREGLARLLEGNGFDVRSTLPPHADDVELVLAAPPDVVVVDISSAEGLTALRALAAGPEQLRTVAVAVSATDAEILQCAQAAVAGYVPADASGQELVSILSSVARGEMRCLPGVAGVLRRRLASIADGDPTLLHRRGSAARLTSREAEIAGLLERGLSNKEIGGRLHIEVSTVKSHVHRILQKLRVGRRGDAVACLQGRARRGTAARGTGDAPLQRCFT